MAYKKEDLIKKSLAAIKKHELIFIDEVVSYLPCHLATFYRLKCEECEDIKSALEVNRISTKAKLRKSWKKSDNAALNIALYKLCSTNKELDILTTQKNKTEIKKANESKGKTLEELEQELEALGLSRTDKEGA
jgi:hypothetical protein